MTEALSPWNTARVWRWRVFASTWLCYAGLYFCRKPFFIVKSAMGEELGFDAEKLGWIGFAYLLAYTFGQFASGALGQRIGSRRLLLGGMTLSLIAGVGFGMVEALAGFALLMVVNGVAQATGWSGAVGNMANWFRRRERGTVMGFWATCYQVGGVGANGLAAWVLIRYGYRYAFFAGALVLAAVMLFFFFNQANSPEDKGFEPLVEDEERAADGSVVSGGSTGWSRQTWITVLLVGVFYFFVKFIRYALWSWAPFFLDRNFGLAGDDAGYIATLFDLFGIGGVIFAGWVSDRLFHGRRAKVAFLMLLGMLAATAAMATFGGRSVLLFAICMGATGFTLYGPDALMTGAGAMDIGSRHGAILAAGIINGMGSIGSVVQEPLIGWMYSHGDGQLEPILWLLMGAAALAAVSLSVVLVRNKLGLSDA